MGWSQGQRMRSVHAHCTFTSAIEILIFGFTERRTLGRLEAERVLDVSGWSWHTSMISIQMSLSDRRYIYTLPSRALLLGASVQCTTRSVLSPLAG